MEPQVPHGQFEEEQEDAPAVSPLELVGFALKSAKRHWLLAIGTAAGVLVVGLSVSSMIPQWYQSEARILVEESAAKTALLSSGSRWQQGQSSADPIAESMELILRKSNLESVVEQTKVLDNWDSLRPPPVRLIDTLMSHVSDRKATRAEQVEALAQTIAARTLIYRDKNIVAVQAQWKDKTLARRLAQVLKDQLLSSLQNQDFSSINAAISLLENEVKQAAEQIPPAREAVVLARKRLIEGSDADQESASKIPAQTVNAKAAIVEHEGADANRSAEAIRADKKMLARLTEIREEIKVTEAPWQRRLAELKLQLLEMKATYGPEHPLIVQQDARIAAATAPPPELRQLRAEEQDLLSKIQSGGESTVPATKGNGTVRFTAGTTRVAPRGSLRPLPSSNEENNDPAIVASMAALSAATSKYNDLVSRLDSARLELATAQIAFKQKYVVVSEPEIAKRPTKRLRMQVALASLAGSLLLGLLIGAIRELISGRVTEHWQVKQLGLKVVGELTVPKHS